MSIPTRAVAQTWTIGTTPFVGKWQVLLSDEVYDITDSAPVAIVTPEWIEVDIPASANGRGVITLIQNNYANASRPTYYYYNLVSDDFHTSGAFRVPVGSGEIALSDCEQLNSVEDAEDFTIYSLAGSGQITAARVGSRVTVGTTEPLATQAELDALSGFPGAIRLAATATAGTSTLTLNTAPDVVQINTFAIINPYTVSCEIIRATNIVGAVVTLGTPLAATHAAGVAVLFDHRPVFSLNLFSAVGDGMTDDTAGILAAIAAAPEDSTLDGEGLSYLVSQTITWNKLLHMRRVNILEDAAMLALNMVGETLLGVPVLWLQAGADASRITSVRIEGAQNKDNFIGLDNDGHPIIKDSNREGIRIDHCSDVSLSDIWVQGKAFGVKLEISTHCRLDELTFIGMYPLDTAQTTNGRNYHSGCRTRGGSGHIITRLMARGAGSGILLGGPSSSVHIEGPWIEFMHDNGIYVSGNDRTTITGGMVDTVYNDGTGIKVRGSDNVVVGNTVRNAGLGVTVSGYNTQQSGAAATTTTGAVSAGASVLSVSNLNGFTIGGELYYLLADGTTWEHKTISDIGATTLTLASGVGTGGIPNGSAVYQSTAAAAGAVSAGAGTITLNHHNGMAAGRYIWYLLADNVTWEYQMVSGVNTSTNVLTLSGTVGTGGIPNGRTIFQTPANEDTAVDGIHTVIEANVIENMTRDGIGLTSVVPPLSTVSPPLFMRNVIIANNHIVNTCTEAAIAGVMGYGAIRGAAFALSIRNNQIKQCGSTIAAIIISGSAALPITSLVIEGNFIRGLQAGAGPYGMTLDYISNGNMSNNVFRDIAGHCVVVTHTVNSNIIGNNGLNNCPGNVVWVKIFTTGSTPAGNTGNFIAYNRGNSITVDTANNIIAHNDYDTRHDIGAGIYQGGSATLNTTLVAGTNAGSTGTVAVNGAAGSNRSYGFQTAGLLRWLIRTTNAETGSDNGSDLAFSSRTDAGSSKFDLLTLVRGSSRLLMGEAVDVQFGATTGSKLGVSPTDKLAFYGNTPVVRPVLTYSRATETAAAAGLRAALVALGLVTDSTTA